jgi:hypothetical protein
LKNLTTLKIPIQFAIAQLPSDWRFRVTFAQYALRVSFLYILLLTPLIDNALPLDRREGIFLASRICRGVPCSSPEPEKMKVSGEAIATL